MSELPKVFTVLDELNKIHLELVSTMRQRSMTKSEERVTWLFETAKQQALDIYALERELAEAPGLIASKLLSEPAPRDPAWLVHTETIPPGYLLLNEDAVLDALASEELAGDAERIIKMRVRDLFKKPK